MAAPNENAPERLRDEILAEARRESEAILQRARQDAAELLAKAKAEAAQLRRERLEQARTEAARQKELILATIPVEAGRRRRARVESLLETVHQEIRRQLQTHAGFDSREMTVALAAGAIRQMPGEAFVVKLSTAAYTALHQGLAGEIKLRSARLPLDVSVVADPAVNGDGPMIEDAAGRQLWDNRLLSRLDRLWPELRRQIATATGLTGDNEMIGGGA